MHYELKETILTIENVNLTLNGNVILQEVNAIIKDVVRPGVTQGQVVGFLGPSGIGKTKLFEILAGLLLPTSGQVLHGVDQKPVHAGCMGVVQQNYPLFNHRSVLSNLEIAANKKYSTEKEAKDKSYEYLERFNLREHANMYPKQLSGGQKQRVAIAQQLLCSNDFLLMDEPFSGLDINMVEEVSQMISEIALLDEYTTVIIVSHDIPATAAISDTIWLMGRDRDAQGNVISGAKIKYTFDLMQRNLAWQSDIRSLPAFHQLMDEVRGLFKTL